MESILLFDAECVHCSKAASAVRELSISGLDVQSIHSPKVIELLKSAGMEIPKKPSILVIDGNENRILNGWRLRRHLASLIGRRRSRVIMRLLVSESRARIGKAVEGYSPTRRRVIASVAAGAAAVAGSAAVSGTASASTVGSSSPKGLDVANPADVRRALTSKQMSLAVQTWGPVDQEVYETRDGSLRVLAFNHGSSDVMTFVDNVSASPGSKLAALSMRMSPDKEHAIRYYTVSGAVLGTVGVSSTGKVKVTSASGSAGSPDVTGPQVQCFLNCVGETLPESCVFTCANCASSGQILTCVSCAACAGSKAIPCARRCF